MTTIPDNLKTSQARKLTDEQHLHLIAEAHQRAIIRQQKARIRASVQPFQLATKAKEQAA